MTVEAAREAGLDAFELVADFATSAKGYAVQATFGHVTIVVDRATRELVGAAMACPDASAAIHECVAGDQGPRHDRRPGRDDPCLPVDLADLQRAVRRCAARARRRGDPRRRRPRARGPPAPSTSTIDGRTEASAPSGPAGSSTAAEGMTATSARWPTVSRPRSRSPASHGRVDAGGAQRPLDRERLLRAEGGRAGRPARVLAPDGQRDARPRVERLDRGVGPEGEDRPGLGKRAPGVAVPLGAVAPQPSRLGRVRTGDGRAGRWPRCPRRRSAAGPPGRRAGRARSGA